VKRSDRLTLIGLGISAAAAGAVAYWTNGAFPWWLYVGIGVLLAAGIVPGMHQAEAHRTIIDRAREK
jgi:hypothetical protein